MMGIQELIKDKRQDILRVSAKHGAFNVRIFGSVARGEAGLDSDIDFLVEVGPNHTPFFPGGLLADLEELLGRRVDIVTPNGLHWYLREKILREAIPL